MTAPSTIRAGRREHRLPIREHVDAIREELEAMLLRLPEGKAEASIREASSSLSTFLGRSADDDALVADLDAVVACVRRAKNEIGDDAEDELLVEVERQTSGLRSQVLDQIASFPAGAADGFTLPFTASAGVPALFDLPVVPPPEVLSIRPAWDADADRSLPPEDDLPALEPPPPSLERLEVDRLGRDTLEDIGILGGLRRLHGEEPWSAAIGFEERLLTNFDLLFALDRPFHPTTPRLEVPTAAWRYVIEWAVPDWGRSFALAATLGSTRGPAAIRWVVLALRRAPPLVHGAFVDGLALGSSPEIDAAVIELLRDAPAPILAVALEVIRRRRVFSAGAVVPLLAHPDEDVAVAAIACLRNAPANLARELCMRLKSSGGPRVALAALRELGAHGDASARAGLRALLEDADKDRAPREIGLEALRILALLGDPADNERVVHAARTHAAEHLLGFHGWPSHFPTLWAAFKRERTAGALESPRRLRLEAAFARMTGLDPTAELDALHEAATRRLETLTDRRIRAGRAFDVRSILDEIAAPTTRQAERRDLVLELALTAPQLPRLEPETWVARQRADIQTAREALTAR